MKGHNYGLCGKCGKFHKPTKGMLGKKHSEETLLLFSEQRKGQTSWRKGLTNKTDKRIKKMTEKTKRKIGNANLGEKNSNWSGDRVGYAGIHSWVKRHKLKPKLCEKCHKNSSFDIANISGEYKRDINDFEWLCRRCHMKSDGRIYNLKNARI